MQQQRAGVRRRTRRCTTCHWRRAMQEGLCEGCLMELVSLVALKALWRANGVALHGLGRMR